MSTLLGLLAIAGFLLIIVWGILAIKQHFFEHSAITERAKRLGLGGVVLLFIGYLDDIDSLSGIMAYTAIIFVITWAVMYLRHKFWNGPSLSKYTKYLGWTGLLIFIIACTLPASPDTEGAKAQPKTEKKAINKEKVAEKKKKSDSAKAKSEASIKKAEKAKSESKAKVSSQKRAKAEADKKSKQTSKQKSNKKKIKTPKRNEINARMATDLMTMQGMADGTMDGDGNEVSNGTPDPTFAFTKYIVDWKIDSTNVLVAQVDGPSFFDENIATRSTFAKAVAKALRSSYSETYLLLTDDKKDGDADNLPLEIYASGIDDPVATKKVFSGKIELTKTGKQ